MRRFELGYIRGLKNSPEIFAREALGNARASDTLCIGARISPFNGNHVFVLCGRLSGYGRHQFISLRRHRSAPADYGARSGSRGDRRRARLDRSNV